MKMGRGRSPGAADFGDRFSPGHRSALGDAIAAIVRVDGNDSAGVPDDDHIPIAAELIAVHDLAAFHRVNRAAFRSGDVDAVVKALTPRAESRSDGSRHRPDERRPGPV